ncbi:MAG: transporter [Paenibacillus sp.]|nr:transporter [Paenibacillus sp.]
MRKSMLMGIALFIAALNLRPAINSVAPLLERIRSDLGMSAAAASLLTSIPVLCMGLFSPLAVKAGGKWGIERIIAASLVIIGAGTVIRLWTNSATLLLVSALVAGIGIALIGPLLSGFIKQHFPKHVPSMIAVYTIALSLGAAFSSALATPLQQSLDSWQGSLSFWAIVAFGAAIVWWTFVYPAVKRTTRSGAAAAKTQLPWNSGKAWTLTLSFGLMAMLFYSLTAWLPQIIQGMGYTKNYAASCLTLFVGLQIPVSFILPFLLKRFPSRRLWLIVMTLIELAGLLLLAFQAEPWVAVVCIGIGASGLFSLNLLLPIDATNSAQEAASWSAMTQSAGYVIGAAGPILLGWIHDATDSFTSAVLGMAAITIVMILVQLAATAAAKAPAKEAQPARQ